VKLAIYSALVGVSFGGSAELFGKLQKSIGATEYLMDILEEHAEDIELKEH